MIILMLLSDWLIRKGKWDTMMEQGIQFWNQMYIPIVVAMAATQNVRVAVSSGLLAVLAGIVPVILCIALILQLPAMLLNPFCLHDGDLDKILRKNGLIVAFLIIGSYRIHSIYCI